MNKSTLSIVYFVQKRWRNMKVPPDVHFYQAPYVRLKLQDQIWNIIIRTSAQNSRDLWVIFFLRSPSRISTGIPKTISTKFHLISALNRGIWIDSVYFAPVGTYRCVRFVSSVCAAFLVVSALTGNIVVYINSNSSVQGTVEMEFGWYGFRYFRRITTWWS